MLAAERLIIMLVTRPGVGGVVVDVEMKKKIRHPRQQNVFEIIITKLRMTYTDDVFSEPTVNT